MAWKWVNRIKKFNGSEFFFGIPPHDYNGETNYSVNVGGYNSYAQPAINEANIVLSTIDNLSNLGGGLNVGTFNYLLANGYIITTTKAGTGSSNAAFRLKDIAGTVYHVEEFNGNFTYYPIFCLCLVINHDLEEAYIGRIQYNRNESSGYASIRYNLSRQGNVYSILKNIIPEDTGRDPYADGGLSDIGGGDPNEQNFDEVSDVIGEPSLPSFTATGSGMVTAYVPTLSEMNDIADYLIDPNIIQVLAGTVLKLSDVIIGLNLFPFSVPASQSKVVSINLMGARLGTGINCHYADQQFVTLDMGSIQIEKCWDNCLDFNPYTRISIFLPFCGYYELDTDEVMGKTVNVKYKVDIMTGSCVALVIVDGSVMYQFAGQCASQIPVSSVSFDGMLSSMIDLGMTVASAQAAVGGAAAAAEDAGQAFLNAKSDYGQRAAGARVQATHENLVDVKANAGRQLIGATANAILSSKGFYSHAGGLSSAPGFLGVRKPFIIKKIPKQSIPEGYGKLRGYPSNIYSKLGDLNGYTEVEEIQLNIPNATVAEIAECERILKAGCYL